MQEGKEPMSFKKHHSEHGATTSCTMRLVEEAGLVALNRVVVADSWFSSLRTALELKKLGTYFIGMLKVHEL